MTGAYSLSLSLSRFCILSFAGAVSNDLFNAHFRYSLNPPRNQLDMAKDQDYEAAVVKGTKLLRLIQASDTKATLQSKFKDEKELAKNGYTKHEDGTFEIACIRDVLRDLGVNDDKMEKDGGDNIRTYRIHDRDSVIDGVVYPVCSHPFFLKTS
jgi:hypothetical protein